jgi:predicted O-methyltransferase YrrM
VSAASLGAGADRHRLRRKFGSLVTRANLHRRLRREPPEFDELHRELLSPIEGWRYRQDLALLYLLARDVAGPEEILEIGSYRGLSTTALALGRRHGGYGGPVHAVDPHTGDRQDLETTGERTIPSETQFRANIERAGIADEIDVHVMTSDDLASSWDGSRVRLLFIDGWHSYDAVARDITHWAPLVTPTGVVLIDDYLNYDEVRAAVDDHAPLLPQNGRRAGRMWLAHNGELSPAIERLLTIPWG